MHGNRNLKIRSSLLLLPVLIPLLFIVVNDLNKWKIKMQSHARLEKSRSPKPLAAGRPTASGTLPDA